MNKSDQLSLPFDISEGQHDGYAIQGNTIRFPKETNQAQWEDITRGLAELNSHAAIAHVRVMFLLGDALNYGEKEFGEEAAQAIDATRKHMMLSMKSVENAAWIAASVPPENRHELLTMAHHEAVARLEHAQQRELLQEAEDENLPVAKLKARVKEVCPSTRKKKVKAKTKRKADDPITEEQAVAAAETLAEFGKVYTGRKASEITPAMKKAFADVDMATLYAFARRFTRKDNW